MLPSELILFRMNKIFYHPKLKVITNQNLGKLLFSPDEQQILPFELKVIVH